MDQSRPQFLHRFDDPPAKRARIYRAGGRTQCGAWPAVELHALLLSKHSVAKLWSPRSRSARPRHPIVAGGFRPAGGAASPCRRRHRPNPSCVTNLERVRPAVSRSRLISLPARTCRPTRPAMVLPRQPGARLTCSPTAAGSCRALTRPGGSCSSAAVPPYSGCASRVPGPSRKSSGRHLGPWAVGRLVRQMGRGRHRAGHPRVPLPDGSRRHHRAPRRDQLPGVDRVRQRRCCHLARQGAGTARRARRTCAARGHRRLHARLQHEPSSRGQRQDADLPARA